MAASAQAASFIGAVLEQAGYMAQADFLKQFRDFFREAGALVYILGAIGGLISFVVFGSFRAARYLLLGPALYWFLVGPTFNYDGVVWQVGNGAARGLNGRKGEASSKADVNGVLKLADLSAPGNGIQVAYGFALFTRIINSLSRELTEVITNASKDQEYLRYISKAVALDSAMAIQITDPELINMLEGDYFAKCPNSYSYSLAASQLELRPEVINILTGEAKASAQRRKAEYERKAKEYLENEMINPGPETLGFLRNKGIKKESISCKEMWGIIGEQLDAAAKGSTDQIINIAKGTSTDAEKACERVLVKISSNTSGAGGGCRQKLERAVAMMMLKNTVFDRRAGSRFVNRIVSSLGETAIPQDIRNVLENPSVDIGTLSKSSQAMLLNHGAAILKANGDAGINLNSGHSALAILGITEARIAQAGNQWSPERVNQERHLARTLAKNSAMVGTMDAGLTEYPKYHLRNLRQQLFSWSINLPYWQGIILYLLAIAYPFIALVVLLPGRAAGFLNLPMAWLWVKSWDIGLAFTMLFERVLWNILPTLNINDDQLNVSLAAKLPWERMSEVQKFDHTWNLHLYYICLSMVTLSIPAITGYATLRARRSVLSSFTEKIQSDSKDAGSLAAGAYGTSIMAERTKAQNELQAFAVGMAGRTPQDGGGLYGNASRQVPVLDKAGKPVPKKDANGVPMKTADGKPEYEMRTIPGERETTAMRYASMAAFGELGKDAQAKLISAGTTSWSEGDLRKTLQDRVGPLPEAQAALSAYQNTYRETMEKMHELHQQELATFHPILGRYGSLGVRNIAYVAAVDGFGGFEMEPTDTSSVNQLIGLHSFQFQKRAEISNKLLGGMLDIGQGPEMMGFNRAEAKRFVFDLHYQPDQSTNLGRLLHSFGFGAEERPPIPSFAFRTEGDVNKMDHQGNYNAEIASWKDLYESKKNKRDGTPVTEEEYKQSTKFLHDLNLRMGMFVEGGTHMEVGPGQFIQQIPDKLKEMLEEDGKRNGVILDLHPNQRRGQPNFFEANPDLRPKSEFFERSDDPAKPKGHSMLNPERGRVEEQYKVAIAGGHRRDETESRTYYEQKRDWDPYDWLTDMLDEDKAEERRNNRARGYRSLRRTAIT